MAWYSFLSMAQPSHSVIVSILDSPALGGAETYTLSNLGALGRAGHQVILLTNNATAVKHLWSELPPNCRVESWPFRVDVIGNWKGALKFCWQVPLVWLWWWRRHQAWKKLGTGFVLCTPGFSDRLLVTPLCSWLGYRIIWIEFGPLEPTFARLWGVPRFLYQITKKYVQRVITISETTQASLSKSGGFSSSKIRLVYPGIKVPTNEEKSKQAEAGYTWKHSLGLHPRQPSVVLLGRMAQEKAFDFALVALASVVRQRPDLAIFAIGDGPDLLNLKKIAQELELSNHLHWLGTVSESTKYDILATKPIFIFPSAWPLEGFGMTTIEAAAWGCPIISRGTGPQAEIQAKLGLHLSSFTTPQVLAKMILHALDKPESWTPDPTSVAFFSEPRMHHEFVAATTNLT